MKKKILSAILCMAMLLGVMANPLATFAADADNYLSVAQYRSEDGKHTAPAAPEGKVFAGWYKDAECTQPWGENITEEKAYAKFVNKEVLSVKWQMLAGTAKDSKVTDIRFVTTVDSLKYKEVGFVLTVGNKSTAPQMTNVVYERIAGWVDGNQNYYQPTVFDETSKYFMAWELWNIPNESFAKDIKVDAVWTTLDGTTVYGNDVEANVADNLVKPSCDEGVTFEYPLQAKVATNTTRVKYSETSIGAQPEAYGDYGMQRDATNNTWPNFVVEYDKTYPAGSMFTCKMYVEVDPAKVAELGENAYFWTDSWVASQQAATAKIYKFNQWVDVSFELRNESTSNINFFLNLDNGNSQSKFGDTPMTIYMDNVQVISTDFSKGVTFENGVDQKALTGSSIGLVKYTDTTIGAQSQKYGTYGMRFDGTAKNWPGITATYEKSYPIGAVFHCKIYVEVDQAALDAASDPCFYVSSWYASDHLTGKVTTFNEWVDVGLQITSADALNQLYFFPNFEKLNSALPSGTKITVYIDNCYISEGNFEEGITFENGADQYWFSKSNIDYSTGEIDGKSAIKFDVKGSRWPQINAIFNKAYSGMATRMSFKVYVEANAAQVKDQVYYVGANDGAAHTFNQWEESWVKVDDGASSVGVMVNLDRAITALGTDFPFTVYLTDFQVTKGELEETLTLDNPAEKYVFWRNNADYSFEQFAGSTAMKMAINQNWPYLNLGTSKTYGEEKVLYFKMYAKVDKSLVKDEVYYVGNDDPVKHQFNKWEEGFIKIPAGTSTCNIWFNFEKALQTIGSGNITLYLDDFEIR